MATKMMKLICTVLVMSAVSLAARPASAEQVIFLVRHAERVPTPAGQPAAAPKNMMGDDPQLSAAGQQRAVRLAAMLASTGITRIFTTEYKRTRQTAAPLAEKLKLTPVMAAAKDPAPLLAELRKATTPVLVVGHSNTLPGLISALGVTAPVTIGDDDYDNVFVVVRGAAGKATLIRLKY
jgi:broad specificity phosphatase PhoE